MLYASPHRPLTRDELVRLNRKVVAALKASNRPKRKRPAEIIAKVAAKHGLTPADILGNRRHRPIIAARHAAVRAVAEEHPNLSSSALGRIFGRDHTTILHALGRLGRQKK